MKSEPISTWALKEVADGQMRLVLAEMEQDPKTVLPYRYFLEAMEVIHPQDGIAILDVGCGCGHYGRLVSQFYPKLGYCGTDFSEYMVANARLICPNGAFWKNEFFDNPFHSFDIVLTSSTMEYTRDPFEALRAVLTGFKQYAILHRMRLTDGPSEHFDEPTYAGYTAPHFKWNRAEVEGWLKSFDHITMDWKEGEYSTVIAWK